MHLDPHHDVSGSQIGIRIPHTPRHLSLVAKQINLLFLVAVNSTVVHLVHSYDNDNTVL